MRPRVDDDRHRKFQREGRGVGRLVARQDAAPPSVLGELPDIDGRICRYVAIGSGTVAPDASSAAPTVVAALAPVDVEQVTAAVREARGGCRQGRECDCCKMTPASARCAAAEDLMLLPSCGRKTTWRTRCQMYLASCRSRCRIHSPESFRTNSAPRRPMMSRRNRQRGR